MDYRLNKYNEERRPEGVTCGSMTLAAIASLLVCASVISYYRLDSTRLDNPIGDAFKAMSSQYCGRSIKPMFMERR